jgi:hypothetical protein
MRSRPTRVPSAPGVATVLLWRLRGRPHDGLRSACRPDVWPLAGAHFRHPHQDAANASFLDETEGTAGDGAEARSADAPRVSAAG